MGKLIITASIATTTIILLVKAQAPTVILRLILQRFSFESAAVITTAQPAHAIFVMGIAMQEYAPVVKQVINSLVAFARLVRPELTAVLRILSATVLPVLIVNHVIPLLAALSATLGIVKTMVAVLHAMLVHLMMEVAIHVLYAMLVRTHLLWLLLVPPA
jgi:hypothetical protein